MPLMQTPDLRDLEPICDQDYAAEPAGGTPSTDRSTSKSWPAARDPIPDLEYYDTPVHNLDSVAPPFYPLLLDGISPAKATSTNRRLTRWIVYGDSFFSGTNGGVPCPWRRMCLMLGI